MGSRLLRLFCGSVALIGATACREGARIQVTQSAERVVFTIVPISSSFDACIKTAYVYSLGGGVEKQIWDATRGMKTKPCLRSIAYSSNPRGFSASRTPALRPGETYRVALLGPGFNETRDFLRQ